MINYIKLGNIRGISIELNTELGIKALFKRNSFKHETIIDIPYAQIIYTSGRWCAKKRVPIRSVANGNKEIRQTSKNTKRANDD